MSAKDAFSATIPGGAADTASPPHPLTFAGQGVFRFWRWLTCGHGRHVWQLHAAYDLDEPVAPMSGLLNWLEHGGRVVAVRHCLRCGLVEVLE